jgi:hypothetical protein
LVTDGVRAVGRESDRVRATLAAGGSDDEGDFAVQISHVFQLLEG